MTLVATPGAADANAYATVAQARAWAANRVGSASFLALTDDQIEQGLITGAVDIDTLEDDPGFIGDRYSDDQVMAWPRDEATLPEQLVRANIELAISYTPLFAAGATGDALSPPADQGNIKRKKTDVLEKEYFAATKPASATSLTRFPAMVQRLLAGLVVSATSSSSWGSAVVTRTS